MSRRIQRLRSVKMGKYRWRSKVRVPGYTRRTKNGTHSVKPHYRKPRKSLKQHDTNILYQHGIPGQQWGVIRWPEFKRLRRLQERLSRKRKKKQETDNTSRSPNKRSKYQKFDKRKYTPDETTLLKKQNDLKDQTNNALLSRESRKEAKKLYSKRNTLDYSQLRDALNKFQKESDLSYEKQRSTKERDAGLRTAGKLAVDLAGTQFKNAGGVKKVVKQLIDNTSETRLDERKRKLVEKLGDALTDYVDGKIDYNTRKDVWRLLGDSVGYKKKKKGSKNMKHSGVKEDILLHYKWKNRRKSKNVNKKEPLIERIKRRLTGGKTINIEYDKKTSDKVIRDGKIDSANRKRSNAYRDAYKKSELQRKIRKTKEAQQNRYRDAYKAQQNAIKNATPQSNYTAWANNRINKLNKKKKSLMINPHANRDEIKRIEGDIKELNSEIATERNYKNPEKKPRANKGATTFVVKSGPVKVDGHTRRSQTGRTVTIRPHRRGPRARKR